MRKLKNRWVRIGLISAIVFAVTMGAMNWLTPDTNAPQTAPPAPKPAPVVSTSASASPSPAVPTAPGGVGGGQAAAGPTQSASDTQALAYLDFHWGVFTDALTKFSGKTTLSAAQIAKPPVVITKDVSGCPPGAENRASKAIQAVMRFCPPPPNSELHGKIHLVADAFLKLNESDQRTAAASAFIYHALSKTNKEWRNTAQVLGCLQASLSYSFEKSKSGQAEQVWVVMSESLTGGDAYSSYHATMDYRGEWS